MTKKIRNIIILLSSFLLLMTAGCTKDEAPAEPELHEIEKICELSTLDCFYHGVAKSKLKQNKILSAIGIKDPRIWVEYDAEVELGIDNVDIKCNGTDVTVYLPEAKVLDVDIIDDSYSEENIIAESALLNKMKPGKKEMNKAVKDTAEQLEKMTAESDDQLQAARSRAEKLIENYINGVGAANGITYNIKFETLK